LVGNRERPVVRGLGMRRRGARCSAHELEGFGSAHAASHARPGHGICTATGRYACRCIPRLRCDRGRDVLCQLRECLSVAQLCPESMPPIDSGRGPLRRSARTWRRGVWRRALSYRDSKSAPAPAWRSTAHQCGNGSHDEPPPTTPKAGTRWAQNVTIPPNILDLIHELRRACALARSQALGRHSPARDETFGS